MGRWLWTTFLVFYGCCSFLVFVVEASSQSDAPIVFPYTIQTPHYNATWESGFFPAVSITAFTPNSTKEGPTHLLTINFLHFLEFQGNSSSIHNWTLTSEFAQVLNLTTPISKISANTNYSTSPIHEPNRIGIRYIGRLSNGAIFDFNYTLNPNSTVDIPITRPDADCSIRSAQETNCTCKPNHVIDPYTMKFTFQILNWPFAPPLHSDVESYVRLQSTFTGPFNIDYYASLPDANDIIYYRVCDVANTLFNMTTNGQPGQVILPFSLFSNFLKDEEPSGVYVITDPFEFQPSTGEFAIPFGFIFEAFNESLFYDPDFSVLIAGVNHGTGSGGGAGDGGGKNGGALQGGAIAGIVIGCVAVGVLVALAVGTAVIAGIYVKRRITQRSSDIRF
eukprot:TRINITY_DN722_c0_g3_i5.p1 TRINITY_DN722_c0_g3~~TRINITY_DN722_c0_g3_i5.p1  ORF type:complete len:392 (-),score=71.77 TRINITY_DN722_c0_g3_i5:1459-2634(-)